MKERTLLEKAILWGKYAKLSMKATWEYKFDRSLLAFAIFCREMIGVVVMGLLLARFVHIKDWQMNELFFLYSFLFLSYALFVLLFAGVRDFDSIIHSGEFDRYLTKPLGLLYQVIASRVDLPTTLGHGIVGIILFMKTAFSVGIVWNAPNIVYYVAALLGGAVIQASIFMLSACFSFWTIRAENLRNLIFFNARRIAGYPISFYPGIIQKVLLFVLPFSFVNYFPAQYFLRKSEMSDYWSGYLFISPIIGCIMFGLVYLLWQKGVRSYASTGNSMF